MTVKATLKAKKRDSSGKGAARRLRAAGQVPAVVYGADMETVPLTIDAADAVHLFQSISVENTIVDLEVEGEEASLQTLVREIQTHPYRPDLLHVDFYRIQEGVEVELEIPVRLEGTPLGVQESEGVLEQIVHELPVRCVPAKIPEVLTLDVSHLDMHEAIHVSDLDLGEGVTILLDPERTICTVVAPKIAIIEPDEVEEADVEVALVGEEGEELEEVPEEAPEAEGEDEEEEEPG